MSDQIKWDHQLVRKFSSKNHFKLLNQLRNEIKAYPLKRKRDNSNTKNELTTPAKSSDPNLNINNQNQNLKYKDSLVTNEYESKSYTNNSQLFKSNQNQNNLVNKINNDNKIFNNTQNIQTNTPSKAFASYKEKNITKDTIINDDDSINLQYKQKFSPASNDEFISSINNDTNSEYSNSTLEQPTEVPISFKERLSQIDMR